MLTSQGGASAPGGSLAIARVKAPRGQILYLPGLKVQHLPACICGAIHPLAQTPPVYITFCAACGLDLPPLPQAQVVEPVITSSDPGIRLGLLLHFIGKVLASLRSKFK